MIRQRFEYHAPGSIAEVVELLATVGEDAQVVGGGTWLVPEMSRGLRQPRHVVDLRRAGLAGVSLVDDGVMIGARTTYAQLEQDANVPELIRSMARGVTGGAQIRNQGTIGGSACYAIPSSDVPGVLVALDASLRLASVQGERDVHAAEFFRGAFETVRKPGELLSAVIVRRQEDGARHAYEKFKLAAGSWPIVTAACIADASGSLRSLVVGGAAATPVRVPVESVGDDLEDLGDVVSKMITEPWSDPLATGDYRKTISGVIAMRAVETARNGRDRR